MFSYSIPLRFSLGNNTQDCDTCISKLEDNGICSCIQNGCNPYSSGIIPNECIHHFIANEDGNPECLGRMISHFSHCEPNHSGNFIIFARLFRNEINLDLVGVSYNFITLCSGIRCYQTVEEGQGNYARKSLTNPAMTKIFHSISKAIQPRGNMNFMRSPILNRMSGGNTKEEFELKVCEAGMDICMAAMGSPGLHKSCQTLRIFNEGLSTMIDKSLPEDGCIMFTDEDNEKMKEYVTLQLEEQKKLLEERKEQYPDAGLDDQIAMIETRIQETRGFRAEWICICSTDGCNDNMLQPAFEFNPATNQTTHDTTKMDVFNPITSGTTEISQPQPTTQEPGNETGGETSEISQHQPTTQQPGNETGGETSEISQPQPTTYRPGNLTGAKEQSGNEGACVHSNLLQIALSCFIFINII